MESFKHSFVCGFAGYRVYLRVVACFLCTFRTQLQSALLLDPEFVCVVFAQCSLHRFGIRSSLAYYCTIFVQSGVVDGLARHTSRRLNLFQLFSWSLFGSLMHSVCKSFNFPHHGRHCAWLKLNSVDH